MKKNGFTLVELLVVSALILILSGVVLLVINPEGARSKSRDAQRVSDINYIKSSLEVYLADNGTYPCTGTAWFTTDDPCLYSALLPSVGVKYLSQIPFDPLFTASMPANPCERNDNDFGYSYYVYDGGYSLTAVLENEGSQGEFACEESKVLPTCAYDVHDTYCISVESL